MDPKGLFLAILNLHFMCGPTFEENIQCLLASSLLLPIPRMLCYHKWGLIQIRYTKIAFSVSWMNRILLRGQCWISYIWAKTVYRDWQKHYNSERPVENTQDLLVCSFILVSLACNNNSPKGEFKPGPNSGHPLAQWLAHELVLIAVIIGANVKQSIA